MANELNQANFETLMLGAKRSIKRHQASFKGLRTESVRVGFFTRTKTRFPVVTVMPVRWVKGDDFANLKYRVTRIIEFQCFVASLNSKEASSSLRDYIEAIRELIINENYQFFFEDKSKVPQSFNRGIMGVNYNPNQIGSLAGGRGIYQANIRVAIKSKERRPDQPEKTTRTKELNQNKAADLIFRKLMNNKNGRLRNVKEFRRDSETFKQIGTTLSVVLENEDVDEYSAGADLIDLLFDIVLRTKVIADEQSILRVVSTVETIKDILDEDESFSGFFWNSVVDSIGFEQQVRNDVAFYIARLSFIARWLRSTRFENRG